MEEEEESGVVSSRLGQREEASPHPLTLSPPYLLQGAV